MTIPDFNDDGLLPPGVHRATRAEVEMRYGWCEHRRDLLAGLRLALGDLKRAGCGRVFLDGSFVTAKETPNDFDLVWDTAGVTVADLHPALRMLAPPRFGQQARYRGDILPNVQEASSGQPFIDFFQVDKNSMKPKGIIEIELGVSNA